MASHHYLRAAITAALQEVPPTVGIAAAGLATAAVGIEAFRSVSWDDLPAPIREQLRRDGTRGELRSPEEARAVFEQNVPAEARGSIEGIETITHDPDIPWMHKQPHSAGGSNSASNGVYGPEGLNSAIGDRPMTQAEVAEAEAYTLEIAEQATPGVTGDLSEVVGDTLETGAWGGVMGGGIAVAHRWAQVQGYRDSGRHDLAAAAEEQLVADAAKGAVNGVVRGTTVAVTQAVLGANPLTAGIGLVAPDAIALVCAGPIGWLGLAGLSIASAYGKASAQGSASPLQGG